MKALRISVVYENCTHVCGFAPGAALDRALVVQISYPETKVIKAGDVGIGMRTMP
jgi:hypothetical protein